MQARRRRSSVSNMKVINVDAIDVGSASMDSIEGEACALPTTDEVNVSNSTPLGRFRQWVVGNKVEVAYPEWDNGGGITRGEITQILRLEETGAIDVHVLYRGEFEGHTQIFNVMAMYPGFGMWPLRSNGSRGDGIQGAAEGDTKNKSMVERRNTSSRKRRRSSAGKGKVSKQRRGKRTLSQTTKDATTQPDKIIRRLADGHKSADNHLSGKECNTATTSDNDAPMATMDHPSQAVSTSEEKQQKNLDDCDVSIGVQADDVVVIDCVGSEDGSISHQTADCVVEHVKQAPALKIGGHEGASNHGTTENGKARLCAISSNNNQQAEMGKVAEAEFLGEAAAVTALRQAGIDVKNIKSIDALKEPHSKEESSYQLAARDSMNHGVLLATNESEGTSTDDPTVSGLVNVNESSAAQAIVAIDQAPSNIRSSKEEVNVSSESLTAETVDFLVDIDTQQVYDEKIDEDEDDGGKQEVRAGYEIGQTIYATEGKNHQSDRTLSPRINRASPFSSSVEVFEAQAGTPSTKPFVDGLGDQEEKSETAPDHGAETKITQRDVAVVGDRTGAGGVNGTARTTVTDSVQPNVWPCAPLPPMVENDRHNLIADATGNKIDMDEKSSFKNKFDENFDRIHRNKTIGADNASTLTAKARFDQIIGPEAALNLLTPEMRASVLKLSAEQKVKEFYIPFYMEVQKKLAKRGLTKEEIASCMRQMESDVPGGRSDVQRVALAHLLNQENNTCAADIQSPAVKSRTLSKSRSPAQSTSAASVAQTPIFSKSTHSPIVSVAISDDQTESPSSGPFQTPVPATSMTSNTLAQHSPFITTPQPPRYDGSSRPFPSEGNNAFEFFSNFLDENFADLTRLIFEYFVLSPHDSVHPPGSVCKEAYFKEMTSSSLTLQGKVHYGVSGDYGSSLSSINANVNGNGDTIEDSFRIDVATQSTIKDVIDNLVQLVEQACCESKWPVPYTQLARLRNAFDAAGYLSPTTPAVTSATPAANLLGMGPAAVAEVASSTSPSSLQQPVITKDPYANDAQGRIEESAAPPPCNEVVLKTAGNQESLQHGSRIAAPLPKVRTTARGLAALETPTTAAGSAQAKVDHGSSERFACQVDRRYASLSATDNSGVLVEHGRQAGMEGRAGTDESERGHEEIGGQVQAEMKDVGHAGMGLLISDGSANGPSNAIGNMKTLFNAASSSAVVATAKLQPTIDTACVRVIQGDRIDSSEGERRVVTYLKGRLACTMQEAVRLCKSCEGAVKLVEPERDLGNAIEYLENRLSLSQGELRRAIIRRPRLLTQDASRRLEIIATLFDKCVGMDAEAAKSLLLMHVCDAWRDAHRSQVKHVLKTLKSTLSMSHAEIKRTLSTCPQLFTLGKSSLDNRFGRLKDVVQQHLLTVRESRPKLSTPALKTCVKKIVLSRPAIFVMSDPDFENIVLQPTFFGADGRDK